MELEELNKVIEDAKSEWLKENKDIRKKVFETLDKQRDGIIFNLMGFSKNWRYKLEIDHCDGRTADSFIGQVIKEVGKQAALDWLRVNLQDVHKEIELDSTIMQKLIEEAKSHFASNLRATLLSLAAASSAERAKKLLPVVTEKHTILTDDMLLLAPPTQHSVEKLFSSLKGLRILDLCLISEDRLDKWLFRAFNDGVNPELIKSVKEFVKERQNGFAKSSDQDCV